MGESDGCINVLKVLGRMPGAQTPSKTHPITEKRIEKIQELKAQYTPQTLKAEGEKLLNQKNNSLLNYEVFTEQLPDNLSYSGLKVFPITGQPTRICVGLSVAKNTSTATGQSKGKR